ncbi:MAG: SMC-Scp complex subunit ScpB [Fidelibacterota bacterium]
MGKNSVKREEERIVEVLLFSTEEVLTQAKVDLCFDNGSPSLDRVIPQLQELYDRQERPFTIERVAGGYRLVTRPEYEPWISRLRTRAASASVSRAALEAMAVTAYKGPVSRAEIESIRGVNSGSVIKTLLEKDLIKIKGRAPGPGRPLIYSVTDTFLATFGLDSLSDLPKLREISELMSEGPGANEPVPGDRSEPFDPGTEDAPE